VEEGKLDLDAPVERYVPGFPAKDPERPITARLLAGHLSGIRHYAPADSSIPPTKTYANLSEALGIFRDDPLLSRPGDKYNYSSYAYNLLGVELEGAGGGEYLSLVRRYVLTPLRLERTGDDDPYALVEHRARPYEREADGTLRNERAIDSRFKLPSGGFLSTAPDLARFAGAHAKAGFLQKKTLDLLFTGQKTTAGEETGVGIGWRVGLDTAGRRIHHHGGSIEGGRSMLVLYPDQDLAIAILTNLSQARYGTIETQKVAEPFLAALGAGDPNQGKPAN
jgi:CubicO group peptidase (beta-lactamase class C family)